ncbi:MAG: hypothetical protein AAF458_13980 [Pseudomonadota bacterium]
MASGLLAVAFDFADAHADEFHDWYDLEHLPERESVPGFGRCERWLGATAPSQALATYDLDTVGVLDGDAYRAIAGANLSPWSKRVTGMCTRLLRFEGEQLNPGVFGAPEGAGALLLNAMNIESDREADFNAWYDEEHLPALAAVPGVLAARRYRGERPGNTHRYVAVYHLASPDLPTTTAWKQAIDTPWSARMRPHFRDHFRVVTVSYTRA